MKPQLPAIITSFFTVYLPLTMGYSQNTIQSYRDTFVLLLTFANEKHLCTHGRITISLFLEENILGFLAWLEDSRHVGVSTRNQRLAALKSFAKYASSNSVEQMDVFQKILDIRPKKGTAKTVDYLSVDAVSLLLKQPDSGTKSGIRHLAILSLLYESGCRVQEIADLKFGDISLTEPPTITVKGKGRKVRVIPISPKVLSILKKYTEIYNISVPSDNLFTNNRKETLTRSGIAHILGKYTAKAKTVHPELYGNTKVHPHVLRHSKAMHMLESGVNLIYIRDFLGHASVTTTEIYAKSNPEIKRKFLEQAASNIDSAISVVPEEEKTTLLEWLKNNI